MRLHRSAATTHGDGPIDLDGPGVFHYTPHPVLSLPGMPPCHEFSAEYPHSHPGSVWPQSVLRGWCFPASRAA